MKTSCNVVQDVFVLYQDGALSEETRLEVKNHLRKCRDCRAFYQEMKSGYGRSSGRRGASLVMKPEAELSFENVAQTAAYEPRKALCAALLFNLTEIELFVRKRTLLRRIQN